MFQQSRFGKVLVFWVSNKVIIENLFGGATFEKKKCCMWGPQKKIRFVKF